MKARKPENTIPDTVPEIGPENQISMFWHCGLCLKEKPDNQSAMEYARIQAGYTPRGLQVWCNRHDVNIANVDFQGYRHPACMDRIPLPNEIPSKKEQH